MQINIKKVFAYISIIGLCEPLGLYSNKFIHPFFAISKIIALLYTVYLITSKQVKLNKFLILVISYWSYLIIPTVLNKGDIRVWFREFYMYISICAIIQYRIQKDPKGIIKFISSVLAVILLLNLISLFKIGIDNGNGNLAASGAQYLIGIRTRIGDWSNIAIPISLLWLGISRKKINLPFIICLLSSLIFMVMTSVSASILSCIIFFILILITYLNKYFMRKFINIFLFSSLGLSILLIVFKIQNYFSWLIVDILKEDLTLNSRSYIWESVLVRVKENLLLGHGLGVDKIFYYGNHTFFGAHNQFLSILFESGLIGISLFLVIIFVASSNFKKSDNKAFLIILGSALIVYCFSMVAEVNANNICYYMLLTFIANINKFNNIEYEFAKIKIKIK